QHQWDPKSLAAMGLLVIRFLKAIETGLPVNRLCLRTMIAVLKRGEHSTCDRSRAGPRVSSCLRLPANVSATQDGVSGRHRPHTQAPLPRYPSLVHRPGIYSVFGLSREPGHLM